MSLCYDFQKCTIISLVSVAISLITGLVTLAYGQETEFKTYTNNIMKFSIQYPENWRIDPGSAPVEFCINYNVDPPPEEDVDCRIWADGVFEIDTGEPQTYLDTDTMTLKNHTLPVYCQALVNDINSEPSNTLIRQNPVTVLGNSGCKIEWKWNGGLATITAYHFAIMTIADGRLYKLEYQNDELKVPETLPLANKMVESFKVIK